MGECLVDSGCHKLSENIWFVWSSMVIPWSRTPYSGEKVGCDAGPRTDGNVKIELESAGFAIYLLKVGHCFDVV